MKRWAIRPGVWLLVALTYLPSLTAKPGRMPSDTKLSLYLDPRRLIADAPYSWDTRQFAGWVPHQTIAYLWPSGPWYVAFDLLGAPDWIAHRLWLGTVLFLGGLGVRWAGSHLGLTAAGATVAGAVYALSPYILPYVSRTSVMLLPWAGVGWLVGLTIRAATRSRWRDAALFALVVLTVGAVNAAALALIAPAPVLWLVHALWQRTITWRAAVVVACKLGGLSLLVSLWWIVMLIVQARHGADVLAYSETLEAVSHTSVSTEALRGLGYWLFYVRDPYAFTTTASAPYMTSIALILVGWFLLAVCLLGLALTRWSHRRYAALLVGVGVVLAVGVHPIDDPSPLMGPLRDSTLGLALRSSTRAVPLSTFGVALGAGALVSAAAVLRWRARHLLAPLVVALAVANLPAAFTGGYVDAALERDQDVPDAWAAAAEALDAGSTGHRVMQLPGSEFGAFRWGYTVDPPLPGLTGKPLVTRDLLPLGSPAAMDLLYALDNRVQAGTVEPASIAPVARLLAVDRVWVANDLAFDRFRTPRPETVAAMFARVPEGLGRPQPFGAPVVNVPDVAMLDEQELADPAIGTPLAPVELVGVTEPVPVVRAATEVVVLAGSGDGIVDAAAAGLLHGDEAVVYAGDLAALDDLGPAVPDDAPLIVTDSNRDRAMHWRSSQDTLGMTERGGPAADATRTDVADQRLAATASTDERDQTVAVLEGGLEVEASSYGELFAYRPEHRPAMAVDGDPATAWRVADRADPVGESITVSSTAGFLTLLQDQTGNANRTIARVRIQAGDAEPQVVELDDSSTTVPGQHVEVTPGVAVTITIDAVVARPEGIDSGPSAVGFAELGPRALEDVRLPARPLDAVDEVRPLAIVMTRDRTRPTNRWRSDPEPVMRRRFTLPVARRFDATVTLRLDARAGDAVLDTLAGRTATAVSDRRLTGVPGARGGAAVDGDAATGWTTPLGQAVGSSLTVVLDTGASAAAWQAAQSFEVVQVVDGRHSPITRLAISPAGATAPFVLDVPPADAGGRSRIGLTAEQAHAIATGGSVTVTVVGVDTRTTVDRRYGEPVALPAAIAELGLPVAEPVAAAVPGCHDGLVTVDGAPLGVTFGADAAARLLAGEAVDAVPCSGAVELSAGVHQLVTSSGAEAGVQVDRVTLRSGEVTRAAVAEPVVRVERTRTTRRATVAPCPAGCWLIMGEGYNDAWTASGPDGSLGAPVPISGGFNGWWLPPAAGERTVEMSWPSQRDLNIALLLTLGAVVLCVVVACVDRTRFDRARDDDEPMFDLDPPPLGRRSLIGPSLVLVVGAGVVIEPVWAVAALIPVAALMVVRRPHLLVLAAAVGAGSLGLIIARRQHAYQFPADAAWPVHFDDLHAAGLFVVVLVVAGSLSSTARGFPGLADDAPPSEAGS